MSGTRRPKHGLGLVLLALFVGLAACSQPQSTSEVGRARARHDLVERLDDGSIRSLALRPREVRGETRAARVVAPGEKLRLAASEPGRLRLSVAGASAEDGPADGALHLGLEAADGRTSDVSIRVESGSWQAVTPPWDLSPRDTLSLSNEGTVPLAIGDLRTESRWVGPIPPVIVLIVIDTLRADHTSLHPYDLDTTPNLTALAREGLAFERAYAPAPWTRPSVATFLTGLSPEQHGTWGRYDRLTEDSVTWAEMARERGYRTVAVVTNPNVLALWGFAQGFDRFIDVDARGWLDRGSDARQVVEIARDVVENEPQPLFLFLHLLDPHGPYDPPIDSARALFPDYSDDEPGFRLAPDSTEADVLGGVRRYDGEIRHADAALGEIVGVLQREGLWHDAAVVLVADHGEEFFEHGGFSHGKSLYEEQLRVPMVIKLPRGRSAGTKVGELASIADALPTVNHALGWPLPDAVEGRRWLDEEEVVIGDRWLMASLANDGREGHALIGDRHKLIRWTAPEPRTEVYDLSSDPREDQPIVDAELESRLGARLDEQLLDTRSGWHLRLCGGTADLRVRLRLTGIHARPEPVDLERRDRIVERSVGTYDLRLRTAPRRRLRESPKGPVRVSTRDVDGVAFEADRPRVRILQSKEPIRTVLGSTPADPKGELELDPDVAWRAASDEPVCRGQEPTLFVWFVARGTETATTTPELNQRLRALGYLEDERE